MSDVAPAVDVLAPVSLTVGVGGAASLSVGGEVFSPAVYHGTTTVTPTSEQQVLATAGTALREDIVIEAVPQYWGLINWDGNVLFVR